QRVARIADVGVAVVVDPGELPVANIGVDRGARHIEQRTQPLDSHCVGTRFRHRSQALRTRAAEELQKHGLRLVVLMMREKNGISPCRRRGVRKRPIACMASFGLDAFPRLAADVDTVLDQWYATLTA